MGSPKRKKAQKTSTNHMCPRKETAHTLNVCLRTCLIFPLLKWRVSKEEIENGSLEFRDEKCQNPDRSPCLSFNREDLRKPLANSTWKPNTRTWSLGKSYGLHRKCDLFFFKGELRSALSSASSGSVVMGTNPVARSGHVARCQAEIWRPEIKWGARGRWPQMLYKLRGFDPHARCVWVKIIPPGNGPQV